MSMFSHQGSLSCPTRLIPLIAVFCFVCVWYTPAEAQGLMEGPPATEQVSGARSVASSETPLVTPGWLPEKPGALLVSFVVGTSLFVVLSLLGTLIVFQRNLNQIKSRLPEDISGDHTDETGTSKMSSLIITSDHELSKLDEAITGCLDALRGSHDSEESASNQQQLVQCLELISLQQKKLNAYQTQNRMVQNAIDRCSVSPVESSLATAYQLRRPSGGLSIKPA